MTYREVFRRSSLGDLIAVLAMLAALIWLLLPQAPPPRPRPRPAVGPFTIEPAPPPASRP
jgi:hypothetical protein